MKILIDVAHPAHVHFFKNAAKMLQERGHKVRFTAKEKEMTLRLLDSYLFDYVCLGKPRKGLASKALALLKFDYMTFRAALDYKPDLYVSLNSPYMAHVAFLMGKPHIAFEDTEDAKYVFMLSNPFDAAICTPDCFKKDFGRKHVRFAGCKELAYLHPNRFAPDPSVLADVGLKPGERFVVLRFISWAAHHDVHLKGVAEAHSLVKSLEEHAKVLITSESPLPEDLDRYRVRCHPDKMSSLLYYADLYIGEGGTMAVEAAVLGTPSIHIESDDEGRATGDRYGHFVELHRKYGLLDYYPDQKQAFARAEQILKDANSKAAWRKKREALLKDKIDVSAWMADYIERFPESYKEYPEGNRR